MRVGAVLIIAAATMSGCDESLLASSCGGALVRVCEPFDWAEVDDASLSPEELPIAGFVETAQIHVELSRCADAPAPHGVDLLAVIGTGADEFRVVNLLTVRDGEDGDPVPGDGVIDVAVTNPFIATIPAETDIALRFVARSGVPGGCASGALEIPYRTGPNRP